MASTNVLRELIIKWGFQVDQGPLKNLDRKLSGLKKTSLGIGAILATTGTAISYVLNEAAKQEQVAIAFTTLIGNTQKAKKILSDLYDFAAKTPFTIPDVEREARRLLAFGFSADELIDKMRLLGNIASSVGIDKLPFIVKAFADVRAAGRLMGREVLQFVNAGVAIIPILEKELGKTGEQIRKMIEQGKISFNLVEKVLRKLPAVQRNIMDELVKTFLGMVANLKDILTLMARSIGMEFLPTAKKLLQQFLMFLEVNKEIIKIRIIRYIRLMIKFAKDLWQTLRIIVDIFKLFIRVVGGAENAIKLLTFSLLVFLQLQIASVVGKITISFFKFAKAIRTVGAAATFMNLALAGLPLLIGAIIVGIAYIIEDIVAWKRGMDSVTESVVNFFDKQITKIKEFLAQFEPIRRFWEGYKQNVAKFTKFYEDQAEKRKKIDWKRIEEFGQKKISDVAIKAYPTLKQKVFDIIKKAEEMEKQTPISPITLGTPIFSRGVNPPTNNVNLSMPVNVTVNKDEDSKKIGDIIIRAGKSLANDFQESMRRAQRANEKIIVY